MGIRSRLAALISTTPPPFEPPQPMRRDTAEPVEHGDTTQNPMSGMGSAYDKGANNAVRHRTAPLARDLEAMARDSGYGGRLIEMIPDDCTRKGWRVIDPTDNAQPCADDDKRLGVRAKVKQAHTWARGQGGAGVFIMADDADLDEAGSLLEPLTPESNATITGLICLDRDEMHAATYNDDPNSGRYREVETWRVQMSKAGGRMVTVHHSRILHFVGRPLRPIQRMEQQGHGDPILRRIMPELLAMEAADDAGRSLLHEVKIDVVKIEGMQGQQAGSQESYFRARMQLLARFKSMHNLIALGKNEDFSTNTASLTGWADLYDRAAKALRTVAGVPDARWSGGAPGGLSTDDKSGMNNWNQVIGAAQDFHYRPPLEHLYALLLAQPGKPEIKEWRLEFNPLDEPSEGEVAGNRKTHAETDAIYLDRGVYSPEQVSASRAGPTGWQVDITPEEIDDTDPEADREALAEITPEAGEKVADTAYNGAQVTGALGIVERVASGAIPRATGVEMLVEFFKMPKARAEAIMGDVGGTFEPTVPPEIDDVTPGGDDGEE